MLLSLSETRGRKIQASDESIGKASDFFFDDRFWTLRYLVVDTGWLFGRKVLIGPEAIERVDIDSSELAVSLTKQQIEESPGIGSDLPVSRQEEMSLRDYYGWPVYWEIDPAGLAAAALVEADELGRTSLSSDDEEHGDPNLRSAREVAGYRIEARDGEIGHVADFIFDDDNWTIRYLVVDTRNWLPSIKVLVAPGWAEQIDWSARTVRVGLDRDAVENSPPYDLGVPIDRDYENSLHEHFGRDPYWK